MATLDLDAKRAARSEAENTPHKVTLGGKTYLFKPLMPLEFLDVLNGGRLAEALRLVLADPGDWEKLRAAVPDEADFYEVARLYGVNVGESSGSPDSSTSGGPPSKPTSRTTTRGSRPSRASAGDPGLSVSAASTPSP